MDKKAEGDLDKNTTETFSEGRKRALAFIFSQMIPGHFHSLSTENPRLFHGLSTVGKILPVIYPDKK